MLSILIPLELFICVIIIVLLIACLLGFVRYKRKKYNTFLASIINVLMQNKMENINYDNKNKLYSLSFKFDNKNYYIKIMNGGKKKGIVMTNPTTIHIKKYSSQYGPAVDSKYASNLNSFLKEKLDGVKILLIKNNMLRITKYINENELEEVEYNIPSFNTFIVQEKDFDKYLEYIINKSLNKKK